MGCVASACAVSACLSCGASCSFQTVRGAKAPHVAILALSAILALFLRYKGPDRISFLPEDHYHASCKGNAAVYRISFMTAVFFIIMAAGSAYSRSLHVGLWAPKIYLYCMLIIGGFFTPNVVFDNRGYAWVSRILSVLFLIAQILILVDFAYSWNDNWLEKGRNLASTSEEDNPATADAAPGSVTSKCCSSCRGNNRYFGGILSVCAGCYIFCIVGIALLYAYYNLCSFNSTIITVTLLLIVILTAVQLTSPEGALLPSAVVSAYATYLCWSALNNNPDGSCSSSSSAQPDNPWLIFAGIVFTGASLGASTSTAATALPSLFQHRADLDLAVRTRQQENHQQRQRGHVSSSGYFSLGDSASGEENGNGHRDGGMKQRSSNSHGTSTFTSTKALQVQPMATTEASFLPVDALEMEGDGGGKEALDADERDRRDTRYIWMFHLILFVGAVYYGMLLTNWGAATDTTQRVSNDLDNATSTSMLRTDWSRGATAMWVNIATQWLAVFLYLWTLCAPRLMPHRDFSV